MKTAPTADFASLFKNLEKSDRRAGFLDALSMLTILLTDRIGKPLQAIQLTRACDRAWIMYKKKHPLK